ncbi:signal peptidase I [Candidatus Daviesbacteria bacterium]|nr:signal peptidase I [Candidatus Daviesbacteria bacterium]
MDELDYLDHPARKSFASRFRANFIDFIQTVVVFGAILALIHLFLVQPHKVSGSSMVPTFHNADYILTDKISYRTGEVKRGDIVVFKNPRNELEEFIKRVVGLPGETIKVADGTIYINGRPLPEPYLPQGTIIYPGSFLTEGVPVKISPNHYFVMGDNRNHSSDSREWGEISKEEIIGKAFFRYWPPKVFGPIKLLSLD